MTTVAVDAGGSGTRVLVHGTGDPCLREFASVNPASVGTGGAERTLDEVVAFVATAAAGRRVTGWWASSTVGRVAAGTSTRQLCQRLSAAGVRGRFLISNDVVPLLFAPPLVGRGAVVVAGTGSAFWAADGAGTVRTAGGYEYLASDQGSAFDLGLGGVRRAAEALDGRAGPTVMVEQLIARYGPDLVDFLRALSTAPQPKQALADLAVLVTDCWLRGDPAATDLVLAAAGQLCHGLFAVRRAAGLSPGSPTVLSGGLFTGCPRFAELVAVLTRGGSGAGAVTVVASPVRSIAAAAAAVTAAGRAGPILASGSSALIAEFDIPDREPR